MRAATAARIANPHAGFTVGDVLAESVHLLWRRLVPFVLIGGLLTLPYLFVVYTHIDYQFPVRQLFAPLNPRIAAFFTASHAAAFICQSFSTAVIAWVAFQDLCGGRATIGGALYTGLRCIPWLTLIVVCQSAGIGIVAYLIVGEGGWIGKFFGAAMVAPGLLLTVMWFVTPSAYVVERLSPLRSLGRSASLTRGSRFEILGILALVTVTGVALNHSVVLLGHAVHSRIVWLAAYDLIEGAYLAVTTVVGIVLYRHLRDAKEGPPPDIIATVFE